ncbi:hypothetical protein [Streptomyces sp. NPDC054804]
MPSRENRSSRSTWRHSRYDDTSQASSPAIVRTRRTGAVARRSPTSSGTRVPSQENGKVG